VFASNIFGDLSVQAVVGALGLDRSLLPVSMVLTIAGAIDLQTDIGGVMGGRIADSRPFSNHE
jgi:hypothetical protein